MARPPPSGFEAVAQRVTRALKQVGGQRISAAAWLVSGGLGVLLVLSQDWDSATRHSGSSTHALSFVKPALRRLVTAVYPAAGGDTQRSQQQRGETADEAGE